MSQDNGPFGIVHRAVLARDDLSHAEITVYVALCCLAVGDTAEVSAAELAAVARAALGTTKRALNMLRQAGLVETEQRRDEHGGCVRSRHRLPLLTEHLGRRVREGPS